MGALIGQVIGLNVLFILTYSSSTNLCEVGATITGEEATEEMSNLSRVMLLGSSEPGLKAKKPTSYPSVKQTHTGVSTAWHGTKDQEQLFFSTGTQYVAYVAYVAHGGLKPASAS